MTKLLIAGTVLWIFGLAGITTATAQAHKEPAYIHSLSDLRLMRAYLDRLTPSDRIDDESVRAIQEIDAAIQDIKSAAVDDGKDIHDHPPIDTHIKPVDRFRKAHEAGLAARHDVSEHEYNASAVGARDRALGHIDKAVQITEDLMHRTEH